VNIEEFRNYCLSKKGVTEEFPFDENVLVFKVRGKMFALTDLDLFESINLKCDPEMAVTLREEFAGVIPGYHMNKKHWNTIKMDNLIPDHLIFKWIDNSYELVIQNISTKEKKHLRML